MIVTLGLVNFPACWALAMMKIVVPKYAIIGVDIGATVAHGLIVSSAWVIPYFGLPRRDKKIRRRLQGAHGATRASASRVAKKHAQAAQRVTLIMLLWPLSSLGFLFITPQDPRPSSSAGLAPAAYLLMVVYGVSGIAIIATGVIVLQTKNKFLKLMGHVTNLTRRLSQSGRPPGLSSGQLQQLQAIQPPSRHPLRSRLLKWCARCRTRVMSGVTKRDKISVRRMSSGRKLLNFLESGRKSVVRELKWPGILLVILGLVDLCIAFVPPVWPYLAYTTWLTIVMGEVTVVLELLAMSISVRVTPSERKVKPPPVRQFAADTAEEHQTNADGGGGGGGGDGSGGGEEETKRGQQQANEDCDDGGDHLGMTSGELRRDRALGMMTVHGGSQFMKAIAASAFAQEDVLADESQRKPASSAAAPTQGHDDERKEERR